MNKVLSRLFAALLIAAIVLGITPMMMSVVKATITPPRGFWVVPDTETFYTNTTPVGAQFNVTVWVATTAPASFAWQVKLGFNASQLAAVAIGYTGGGKSMWFAAHGTTPVSPIIDNTTGSVLSGESLNGADVIGPSNGSLFYVTFQIIAAPTAGNTLTSLIDTATYAPGDTFVLDDNLNVETAFAYGNCTYSYISTASPGPQPPVALLDYSPKPVIVGQLETFNGSASYDPDGVVVGWNWDFGDGGNGSGMIVTHMYSLAGNYSVALTVTDGEALTNSTTKLVAVYEFQPAMLYVDPAQIIDPTLFPPTIVSINVSVNFVTNMYDYAFNLSYNTEMLTCMGAIINRVQNQTNFTPLILIDDGAGFIWINVTYHWPAVPINTTTPLSLVTLYFQVDTIGSSVLHLSDTELSDPSHQNMPHQTGDGFIMTLIRDLAITNVVPSTSWAYQGWPVNVQVTARNNGNISETFNVTAYYDNVTIGTIPVVNLAQNSDTILTFNWNTSGVAEGNYTISALASTVPFEFNVTNNYLADGQVQILTQIRDVAVTNVTTSRTWAYQGASLNVTVTAKNVGDVNESFNLMAFYNASLLGNVSIVDLAPGAEVVEVFTWNTSALAPCSNYTISGQASIVPFEFNTTNNIFVDGTVKIRLVGDINGDGKVDIRDVSLAALAFGTHAGDPRWNPDADITGIIYLVPDGAVDIRDIALISKNFGKSC